MAGRLADRLIDIDRPAAGTADHVVVVVADPAFVERRRPGELDTAKESLLGQLPQGVVNRIHRFCDGPQPRIGKLQNF